MRDIEVSNKMSLAYRRSSTSGRKWVWQAAHYAFLVLGVLVLGSSTFSNLQGYLRQVYAGCQLSQRLESPRSLIRRRWVRALEGSERSVAEPTSPRAGEVLGRIEIPRLRLCQVILEGTDEKTLKRGPGHIESTAFPGQAGNIGIAAHRDIHFRALKDIRAGDEIRVITPRQTDSYLVESTRIVGPDEVELLDPDFGPGLTLVTCFPFYYIGNAPRRFIVRALPAASWPLQTSLVQSQESRAKSEEDYTLQVDVSLVLLHATVQDSRGRSIGRLEKEHFRVVDDGTPQQITFFKNEDIPVAVGIVVDDSGSMRAKRRDVVEAALAFARSSNPQDEMFVVTFNDRVSLALPPEKLFTNDVKDLEGALLRLATVGQTALYDALAVALVHLQNSNLQKKVLVLVSDGGDNKSKRKLDEVVKMADQSGALIYTIGLFDESSDDRNPGVLKKLAKVTGAEAFLPGQISEAVNICETIARDIRSQYTIGYMAKKTENDAKYHKLSVTASHPEHRKLLVRTREGYYGPAARQP
jgi:Ca-activated chloride channel family protein